MDFISIVGITFIILQVNSAYELLVGLEDWSWVHLLYSISTAEHNIAMYGQAIALHNYTDVSAFRHILLSFTFIFILHDSEWKVASIVTTQLLFIVKIDCCNNLALLKKKKRKMPSIRIMNHLTKYIFVPQSRKLNGS